MDIIHHLGINSLNFPGIIDILDNLSIKHKDLVLPDLGKLGKGSILVVFDIKENDLHWNEIEKLLHTHQFSDMIYTTFTDQEIIGSKWSRLIPCKEIGYPQPDSTWVGNKHIFYDNYCPGCGTYKQIKPYRIKSEPKMKNYQFFDLIWGYNLFTHIDVIEKLRNCKVTGFESNEVLIHRSGQPSNNIKQMFVYELTKPGLIHAKELESKTCTACGITKYQFIKRGYMCYKKDSINPNLDIQLTHEWFGDGHAAFHEFLISQRFAKIIIDNKLKGVQLRPIKIE